MTEPRQRVPFDLSGAQGIAGELKSIAYLLMTLNESSERPTEDDRDAVYFLGALVSERVERLNGLVEDAMRS